ncbi:hypothetical protein V6Z12_A10G091000 [Gossypium hirsutum]
MAAAELKRNSSLASASPSLICRSTSTVLALSSFSRTIGSVGDKSAWALLVSSTTTEFELEGVSSSGPLPASAWLSLDSSDLIGEPFSKISFICVFCSLVSCMSTAVLDSAGTGSATSTGLTSAVSSLASLESEPAEETTSELSFCCSLSEESDDSTFILTDSEGSAGTVSDPDSDSALQGSKVAVSSLFTVSKCSLSFSNSSVCLSSSTVVFT